MRSTRPTVASAETTYVDPSALRRLYVHDQQSRAFCAWRTRLAGSLPLTLHGRAELVNSITLALFRKDITADTCESALADLDEDILAGRLHMADLLWRKALERATELEPRAHSEAWHSHARRAACRERARPRLPALRDV